MKQVTRRLRSILLVLILALAANLSGACTPDTAQPEPTPDRRPHYEPVTRELCGSLRVGGVANQFGLAVPSWYEPWDNYSAGRGDWHMSCGFAAEAGDDRFGTHVTRFEPSGNVSATVFLDVAKAEDAFRLGALGFEESREPLDATVASSPGWWDQGRSREYVENEGRSEDIAIDLYGIDVAYIARHENLYMEARMDALVYREDVEEVSDVLHEMVRALMEETVSHLTLTG